MASLRASNATANGSDDVPTNGAGAIQPGTTISGFSTIQPGTTMSGVVLEGVVLGEKAELGADVGKEGELEESKEDKEEDEG